MIIMKIFAQITRLISKIFCLEVDVHKPGTEGATREEHYFSLRRPRMLVMRNGKLHSLTSCFSIIHRYDAKGNLLSCKPFLLMLKQGDRTVFGSAVYDEYCKLTYV